jgi:putative intracellular protease/amidase
VTTLTNADDVVISASQYELLDVTAPYYALQIHRAEGVVLSGVLRDYVTVAGSWGWTSTPEGIFNAILEIAAATYRARVGGAAPVGIAQGQGVLIAALALPPLAVDTIRSFRRFRL